jgi:aminopeptidase N
MEHIQTTQKAQTIQAMLTSDQVDNSASALWQRIERASTNPRERRIAYLLFNCALTPREIVKYCPHEFPDLQEVHILRSVLLKTFVS